MRKICVTLLFFVLAALGRIVNAQSNYYMAEIKLAGHDDYGFRGKFYWAETLDTNLFFVFQFENDFINNSFPNVSTGQIFFRCVLDQKGDCDLKSPYHVVIGDYRVRLGHRGTCRTSFFDGTRGYGNVVDSAVVHHSPGDSPPFAYPEGLIAVDGRCGNKTVFLHLRIDGFQRDELKNFKRGDKIFLYLPVNSPEKAQILRDKEPSLTLKIVTIGFFDRPQ